MNSENKRLCYEISVQNILKLMVYVHIKLCDTAEEFNHPITRGMPNAVLGGAPRSLPRGPSETQTHIYFVVLNSVNSNCCQIKKKKVLLNFQYILRDPPSDFEQRTRHRFKTRSRESELG